MTQPRFVFFGSSKLSVEVLEELGSAGFRPQIIISSMDQKRGRGLKLESPPPIIWGKERDIPTLQVEKLKDNPELARELSKLSYDFFALASYGKIIPENILEVPRLGILNVHPSLLPRFRGANPIRAQILADEKRVGVSIMLMDKEVDHGPLLAQKNVPIPNWPIGAEKLEEVLGKEGGRLLAQVIPDYLIGKIKPKEQNHALATFTKKTKKEDGEIDLAENARENFLKIRAYEGWPGAYFFHNRGGKKIRVIIKDAELANDRLIIKKVVPESEKEISYNDLLKN